ncbi:MAG: sigma-70 family RNA polymerase sigma factor [Planctomycetota bacterium]
MSDAERREAFARLFARHDRWLFSYLVTLLANPAHAEEVFQEVCVVLWREYEKFELGTDFVKWVSVIAHNQVRKFRRQQHGKAFQFSAEAMDQIASHASQRADMFDYRRDALQRCLTKLSTSDRELIKSCYDGEKSTFKSVAHRLGKPENTIYKALNRIRRMLYECINRTLSAEGLH